MKHQFFHALEFGGDHLSAAIGAVERALQLSPASPRAVAYKGALLIRLAEDMGAEQKAIYARNGEELCEHALSLIDASSPFAPEVLFVVTSGMARLPDQMRPGSKTDLRLTKLITDPRFDDLLPHERVIALVLASCLAATPNLANKLQRRAESIDIGLATQINKRRMN